MGKKEALRYPGKIIGWIRKRGKPIPILMRSVPVKTSKGFEKERTFNAIIGDKRVGMLSLRRNSKNATVTNFAIQSKFQGKGVGSNLFKGVLERLNKANIKSLRSEYIFSEAAAKIRGKHKTTFFSERAFGKGRKIEKSASRFLNRGFQDFALDGRRLNATTLTKISKKRKK